jgi:hypothetical protein
MESVLLAPLLSQQLVVRASVEERRVSRSEPVDVLQISQKRHSLYLRPLKKHQREACYWATAGV